MSQLQRSLAEVTCAWCAGTGTGANSIGYTISCMVCGGKGHLSVAQPAQACQQCEGSGKRNAVSPCLACAGTGWARILSQR
ncbi:MAG TPA: hypothetical protein VF723_13890 [Pyrinomonadaceae bacterium]|jgi:DnaJ-class molecular chaperone